MAIAYDDSWEEVRERVRRALRRLLEPSGLPDELVERTVSAGRLNRGTLCCLVADRPEDDDAARSAAAVELVHRASVIRDDIQDRDEVRRGAPSEAALLGEPTALAFADVLLSVGLRTVSELGADATEHVLETFTRMARGQFLDIHGGPAASAHGPFHLAELKTGSLLGLTFWLGGRAARRPEGDCAILEQIGTCLGVAFQLANDVNNVTRDEGRGKTVGSDLKEQRHSSVWLLMAGAEGGRGSLELDAAVTRVGQEVERELGRAQALVPRLEASLPPAVHGLVFDGEASQAFVGDQQSAHATE